MFKILMIAGEASGDLLGANLAKELLRLKPDLQLQGLGGEQMRSAGVDIIFNNHSLNIVGWWEVVKNLSLIRKAMRTIKKQINEHPPNLLILIDYPGFNLRMAQFAKRSGIKVLYYVSPQIWAWKYKRIHTIRRCVDHIAVLFHFEEAIYQQENVPVTFVGHPLATLVKTSDSKETIYQRYKLNPDWPVIALFPGSRMQELQRMLPDMIAAVQLLKMKIPNAQFVLPLAPSLKEEAFQTYLNKDIIPIKNDSYNILSICKAAIVKSGTGTLEVALSQVPLVVIYKGSYFNYWIARLVVKLNKIFQLKHIGLCNIVAQKTIAKELIQSQVKPENIASETLRLLQDQPYRQQILSDLAKLKQSLKEQDSSTKVAQIALNLL